MYLCRWARPVLVVLFGAFKDEAYLSTKERQCLDKDSILEVTIVAK